MSRPMHAFSRQQSFGQNFRRNNVPPEKANNQQTILRNCNHVSVEISTDTSSLWEKTKHCTTLQLFVCMAWQSNTWGGETFDGLWRYAMAPCWWALLAGGGELEALRTTTNAGGSLPYCAFTSTIVKWDLWCYCNTQPLGNL